VFSSRIVQILWQLYKEMTVRGNGHLVYLYLDVCYILNLDECTGQGLWQSRG